MQVCAFAIKDGRVHFANKFVRTDALIKEQEAGKMMYRCGSMPHILCVWCM